jgi:hypothetical protein
VPTSVFETDAWVRRTRPRLAQTYYGLPPAQSMRSFLTASTRGQDRASICLLTAMPLRGRCAWFQDAHVLGRECDGGCCRVLHEAAACARAVDGKHGSDDAAPRFPGDIRSERFCAPPRRQSVLSGPELRYACSLPRSQRDICK